MEFSSFHFEFVLDAEGKFSADPEDVRALFAFLFLGRDDSFTFWRDGVLSRVFKTEDSFLGTAWVDFSDIWEGVGREKEGGLKKKETKFNKEVKYCLTKN